MARRRSYKERSKIWPWVSFVVFGLIVALLGYSVFTQQSPVKVLKTMFASDLASDDIRRLTKTELVALVEEIEATLVALNEELDQCKTGDGFQKGIINTSSATLNMRSEASLESEIVIRIPTGSKVSILYFDERQLFLDGAMGQWCRIKYADQEGWVWGNYLDKL